MSPVQSRLVPVEAGRSGGIVRLALDDTLDEVAGVEFDVYSVAGGVASLVESAQPADRVVRDVFEKEVLLDPVNGTRVDARVRMRSAAVVPAGSVTLAPRPSDAALANALGGFVVTGEYWQLHASVVPGSAALWRCWARRGAWPTMDGTVEGGLDEHYLRFEGRRDETGFSMNLSDFPDDAWRVIAAGFNAAGQMGPRFAETASFAPGGGAVPLLATSVRPTTRVERRKIEVRETLDEFISWLGRHGQVGLVGEVGWSFAEPQWNDVARAWFARANETKLWVSYWAVGETWFDGYPLEAYVKENGAWTPKLQAQVLEENRSTAEYRRGLNFAGPDFDAPGPLDATHTFSNANRFTPGGMYAWNTADIYSAMAARGHLLARLPFRWERIQPALHGELDALELGRMRQSVNAASASGLQVILDVHNYGAYWLNEGGVGVRRSIGTTQVPVSAFADLWRRLAAELNGSPGVLGYGLMNEPVAMTAQPNASPAQLWAATAQAAIDAIRGVALPAGVEPKTILVPAYNWGGVWSFEAEHRNGPFVRDPANRVRYEGHQYFDADRSGRYQGLELTGSQEESWIRWLPNAVMWDAHKTAGVADNPYRIEIYRVGAPARVALQEIWTKGYADLPAPAAEPAEYRIVAINTVDDSMEEYAASVTGSLI